MLPEGTKRQRVARRQDASESDGADAGIYDGMGRERSRQAWLEPLSTEERSEDVRGDDSPLPGKEVTERRRTRRAEGSKPKHG